MRGEDVGAKEQETEHVEERGGEALLQRRSGKGRSGSEPLFTTPRRRLQCFRT